MPNGFPRLIRVQAHPGIQLADKKLPKATTNEALMFHSAVQMDSKITEIPEDRFAGNVEIEELKEVEVVEPVVEEKVEIKAPKKEPSLEATEMFADK